MLAMIGLAWLAMLPVLILAAVLVIDARASVHRARSRVLGRLTRCYDSSGKVCPTREQDSS